MITKSGTKRVAIPVIAAAAVALGGCSQSEDSADDPIFTLSYSSERQECTFTGPAEVPAGGTYTIIVEDELLDPLASATWMARLPEGYTYEDYLSWREPGKSSEVPFGVRLQNPDAEATREYLESHDLPENAIASSYVLEPGIYVVFERPSGGHYYDMVECGTFTVS